MTHSTGPKVEEELACYKAQTPELGDIIDLYAEVFRLQGQVKQRIEPSGPVDFYGAQERLAKGEAVMKDEQAPVEPALFCDAALSLGGIVQRRSGNDFPTDALLASPQLSAEGLPGFIKGFMRDKPATLTELSQAVGVAEEVLAFFVQSLLAPFYAHVAEGYKGLLAEKEWDRGFCPVCGSLPRMAKLRREDGRRVLHCPLCNTEWAYRRIGCPFCDSTDQKRLQYFYSERDQGHRVSVCGQCKKYLKTSDERALGRTVILQVEDVVTLSLDFLAAAEGYAPGS